MFAFSTFYLTSVVLYYEPRDIRALSLITMELIQGYTKDDRAISVDDLHY